MSYRWSAYVTPKSTKGGSNTDFSVFRDKIQFQSNEVCEKFRCVKTSIGKAVEQSIRYEITEK